MAFDEGRRGKNWGENGGASAVLKSVNIRLGSPECDRTSGVKPVKTGRVGDWPPCDALRVSNDPFWQGTEAADEHDRRRRPQHGKAGFVTRSFTGFEVSTRVSVHHNHS